MTSMFQSTTDVFFFFFQAEDGIRDLTVTGVQTSSDLGRHAGCPHDLDRPPTLAAESRALDRRRREDCAISAGIHDERERDAVEPCCHGDRRAGAGPEHRGLRPARWRGTRLRGAQGLRGGAMGRRDRVEVGGVVHRPLAVSPPVELGSCRRGDEADGKRGGPESQRSEEHTSELQSLAYLVCRLLLEKKKKKERKTILLHTYRANHSRRGVCHD